VSTKAFLAVEDGRRRCKRYQVACSADLRAQGTLRATAKLEDLSATGFRVAWHHRLPARTRVWLSLPGFPSLSASVVRADGFKYGCVFDTPLHPAVFESLAKWAASAA
jgi:hypothetical protein